MTDEMDETDGPNIIIVRPAGPERFEVFRSTEVHSFWMPLCTHDKGTQQFCCALVATESTAEIWGSAARSRFSSHRRSIHASDGRASRTPSQ